MLKEFVQVKEPHTHPIRGDVEMDVKKIISGNTTIYIHSPIANFSDEEKKKYFEAEKTKGNPIIKGIFEAMKDCYQD